MQDFHGYLLTSEGNFFFYCILSLPRHFFFPPHEFVLNFKRAFFPASTEFSWVELSSVQSLSRVWLFATQWTAHARPPSPSLTLGAYSNSCPLSLWCHPTISSSVIPFSSHLQSFPASGSFQMSQFFVSVGQSIRVSASAPVLLINIQDSFPLGWAG